ncbi:uncharacterized protein LOC127252228 isoform X4 [Andrographis paniculata]|uniref:uncharacterized protein LOC127252228 isoform X4 n=1 Tax=Andrographis paniculata TaxID=175694 RepID=UPI0021E70657|nr:uncharacterized protein LOC127252228 isoform X4 [Andrographis paniculata]XP_051132359.1 uncharacterized protein LOC127252228 isoform X4 [Andrographis paniculata]
MMSFEIQERHEAAKDLEKRLLDLQQTQYSCDEALLSSVHRDKKKRIFGLRLLASIVSPDHNSFTSDGCMPSAPTTESRLAHMEERFDRFENYARPDRHDPDGKSGGPPVC